MSMKWHTYLTHRVFQLLILEFVTENRIFYFLCFPNTGMIKAIDSRDLIDACSPSPLFHENYAAMVFMYLVGHSTKWMLGPFHSCIWLL